MTEAVLLSIKKRIREFYVVVESVTELWETPHYTTIRIMLQNMGFSGKKAKNYNVEEEITALYKYLNSLRLISNYYSNSHFENWVYGEVDMIIISETFMTDVEAES